ncbi:MAG TPA: non-canonical purine NTP pyrophosphatase [Limnochordales bacterium]
MRPRIVLASTNAGKLREYRALAASGPLDGLVEVLAPGDPALGGRAMPEVPEESLDLGANAAAKARAAAATFGCLAVADDTGLEVDALGGAPGPRAARYAGPGATDAQRVARLLEALRGVPAERRTARFRCAIAVAEPPGAGGEGQTQVWLFEGVCEGRILEAPRGGGGFGYDPVFWVPEAGRSFAELSLEEKNRLSHRARAWRKAELLLVERLLGGGPPAAGRGAGRGAGI